METISPQQSDPPARPERLSVYHLGLVIFVSIWVDAVAAFLAPNRLMMASWFVLTHCLSTLLIFMSGWLGCMIFQNGFQARVLTKAVLVIVSFCVALPMPIAALNMLPWGQHSEPATVQVTDNEEITAPEESRAKVTITSPITGPFVQLHVPRSETAFTRHDDPGLIPPLSIKVTRGFMGVPIMVEWDSFITPRW